ncbi:MAG: C40 family peptidase [Polynucleobacter victoriensis]
MQQTLFNQALIKKARKFSPSFSLVFESLKKTFIVFGACGILSACAILPRFSSLPDFDKEVSAGTEDISIAAIGLVGVPYRYGGNTPKGGFDCSGLIGYVYQNTANKKLPRTTEEMGQIGTSLGNDTPAPGDLVFFNTQGGRHSHVGIYVGKGRFVHAPSKGGTVRLEKITSSYWSQRYTEARRIIQR